MSVQVARAGQVILALRNLDELRAEVAAGRVLPTDHYILVGMPSWRLVSTLPDASVTGFPGTVPSREDQDREQLERARTQILALVNADMYPKPGACRHCGGADLRSARLVWRQSTRVGGSIDSDLDITVFGSSSLQGLDVAPPPEPSLPTETSGGCLSFPMAAFIFMMVPGVINALVIGLLMLTGLWDEKWDKGPAAPIIGVAGLVYFVGIWVFGFWVARRFHRWDARRGRLAACEKELERAKLHARWRNTWICTSCGGKTVVVG